VTGSQYASAGTHDFPAGKVGPASHAPTGTSAPSMAKTIEPWTAPFSGPPLDRMHDPRRIVTPLLADKWERELKYHGLYMDYHDVPTSIRNGFDMGVHHPINHTYISTNHKSALDNPDTVDMYIHAELAAGRYSGPFLPSECQHQIGHFRTSPLGAIPKGDTFRIIQDFSFSSNEMPSVNSDINSDDFPCDWGSFAEMATLVTQAPAGAQGATLDVDAAFRRCPVRPDQQNHFVIQWQGLCYINHCVAFGGASACGVFGRVADAFIAIARCRGFAPCIKWVDDFVFLRFPDPQSGRFAFELEDILRLGQSLGLPWKPSKTQPFSPSFAYVGFEWSLIQCTVAIPPAKKEKYLARLNPWQLGTKVSSKEVDRLLGTLVHCSLAVPEGRSRLVALTRLSSAFGSAKSRFSQWAPSAGVLLDAQYWRDELSREFCGSSLQPPPVLSSAEFWVDASTSFGVGIVFDGEWDAWKLKPGWKKDGRDIGWAEMIAIELGLLAAIARGHSNAHFLVKSDNMGVIGALSAGKSRNLEQNRVLQRVVALSRIHAIWMTSQYVASAVNIADAPSRGIPVMYMSRSATPVPIPPCLHPFITHAHIS
jgi:hypothetical protein